MPDVPPVLLALGEQHDDQLARAAKSACVAVSPWAPGRTALLAELSANAAQLEAQAEAALARAPTGTLAQFWVARTTDPPSAERFVPPSGYWGNAVWRPATGGLTTTSDAAAWFDELAPESVAVWRLAPKDGSVAEIDGAEDWARLVETYPALVEADGVALSDEFAVPGPVYVPDWPRVARDYDAVHLTLPGKVRALFLVRPVADGYTVLLGEEPFDETLWLRWRFDDVERVR